MWRSLDVWSYIAVLWNDTERREEVCVLCGGAAAFCLSLFSIVLQIVDDSSICLLVSVCFIYKKRSLPCSGGDKGGRAADKRCVVAAVEIWTTILIVIGWRPTFPVGTIMALACAVCAQTERRAGRVERRQPRADCCGFSIFGSVRDEKWSCRSRNGDSRTWINRAGSVRALLALWFLGNCEHTARCALSYLPGDIFLWRWLTHTHQTAGEKLWSRVALTCSSATFQRMIWIRKHPLQQPTAPPVVSSHTEVIWGF